MAFLMLGMNSGAGFDTAPQRARSRGTGSRDASGPKDEDGDRAGQDEAVLFVGAGGIRTSVASIE
jgi:hypothetical protein